MKSKTVSTRENEMDTVIKVNSLQEANQKIYSLIQDGKNYREIAKIKFDINGSIKNFNVSQISKIKSEFEPKNEGTRFDKETAEVFRLFKKGDSPIDVVIKTGLTPDFVEQSLKKYVQLNSEQIVPNSFFYELEQSLSPRYLPSERTPNGYLSTIRGAMEMVETGENGLYWCPKCEDIVELEGNSIEDIQRFLIRRKVHLDCSC